MSITRIDRMRNYGVFRDFTWGGDLPEFGRYNLIYGWNWSGKTTLSRLFRALGDKIAPSKGQVTVTVERQRIRNDDFGQVTVPVRVFNRDFVAESVFPTDGGVAPIFILGKQNVENQKQVDGFKATLGQKQTELGRHQANKAGAISALDKFCIDKARVIKDTLRSSGSNPYNDYNKGDFRSRTMQMVAAGDRQLHELEENGRDKLLAQHCAIPKEKLEPLTYRLPDLKTLGKTVADLLSTTVVSTAIQSLRSDAPLSSWVHAGLGLHQERDGAKCLFCNLPMPRDRLGELEAHFNTEYTQFLQTIDDQIRQINGALNAANQLTTPRPADLYHDLSEDYQAAKSGLRRALGSAKSYLDSLTEVLTDKKGRAFEQVTLRERRIRTRQRRVDRLNDGILKHNQACDEFQLRIDSARKLLEADSIAANLEEFEKLKNAVKNAKTAVTDSAGEIKKLDGKIAELERQIVEHRQPAEELNKDLHNYLGHDELRLEIKETGYTVMRHDVPAKDLSEGETTAIALLYFLKSLRDRRFDLTTGVVVLDDPVSSLDANALFLAFGFIQERTKDARQLFILTHNFSFFRQVRNWFHYLPGKKKRLARLYMIDCTHEQDGRCSTIRQLDPLLEKYESEYHFLFACIYRAATATPKACLEQNYMLPNLARRLLEAFLAFRQPGLSGKLWQQLQGLKFDEAKKLRILRFLHTHSHGNAVGEPEHDLSSLSEGHSILNDLLEMIKSEDPAHFSAMVSLITQSHAEDEPKPALTATPA